MVRGGMRVGGKDRRENGKDSPLQEQHKTAGKMVAVTLCQDRPCGEAGCGLTSRSNRVRNI